MDKIKKANKFLFSVFVPVFMFYIIKHPESSTDIVLKGLNLCYFVIIPVIFPFLVFSRMFINSSVFGFLGRILNKPAKILFGVSGEYANAFLIGCVLGFPIGAKTVKEVYLSNKSKNLENLNNKNEAERVLSFCNNCSISFVISAVGITIFSSFKIGLYLFCIQFISAIITGIMIKFIFRVKNPNKSVKSNDPVQTKIKSPKPEINFTEIISESVTGILNICGTVLFFYIVTNVLFEYLKSIPFLHDLFDPQKHGIFSGFVKTSVSGIFEISSGIYSLLNFVNFEVPAYYKLILSSIILSWSGISVHFQIMYILKDIELSLKPYFTGKIIHVIISIIITATAFKIFQMANITEISETFAEEFISYAYPPILNHLDRYTAGLIFTGMISFAAGLVVCICVILFYLFGKRSKKRKKYGII